MAAPKGNKNGLGNRGGGRVSEKEEHWHLDKWRKDTLIKELAAKIESGCYSVRDMFLFKALTGNEKLMTVLANKLLADLHEVAGKDGGPIQISWLTDKSAEDTES